MTFIWFRRWNIRNLTMLINTVRNWLLCSCVKLIIVDACEVASLVFHHMRTLFIQLSPWSILPSHDMLMLYGFLVLVEWEQTLEDGKNRCLEKRYILDLNMRKSLSWGILKCAVDEHNLWEDSFWQKGWQLVFLNWPKKPIDFTGPHESKTLRWLLLI